MYVERTLGFESAKHKERASFSHIASALMRAAGSAFTKHNIVSREFACKKTSQLSIIQGQAKTVSYVSMLDMSMAASTDSFVSIPF